MRVDIACQHKVGEETQVQTLKVLNVYPRDQQQYIRTNRVKPLAGCADSILMA